MKKITAIFVFVIVSIMLTGTAIAKPPWRNHGKPFLMVGDALVVEPSSPTDIVIPLTLQFPPPDKKTVWRLNYETRDLGATAGEDYVSSSGVVEFGRWDSYEELTLRILPDDLSEDIESFIIVFSSTDIDLSVNGDTRYVVIFDND